MLITTTLPGVDSGCVLLLTKNRAVWLLHISYSHTTQWAELWSVSGRARLTPSPIRPGSGWANSAAAWWSTDIHRHQPTTLSVAHATKAQSISSICWRIIYSNVLWLCTIHWVIYYTSMLPIQNCMNISDKLLKISDCQQIDIIILVSHWQCRLHFAWKIVYSNIFHSLFKMIIIKIICKLNILHDWI